MITRPRDCSWVPGSFEDITGINDFQCRSDPDDDYNCIAWALGKTNHFWWPRNEAGYYWPPGLPKEPISGETVDNFIAAFKTEGYLPCSHSGVERKYQKIALFVSAYGRRKHAACLLETGIWSSKLGPSEDIEHATLKCLEGRTYGRVRMFFKKRRPEYPPSGRVLTKLRSFLSRYFGSRQGRS